MSPTKPQPHPRVKNLARDREPSTQLSGLACAFWGGSISAIVAERRKVFEQLSGEWLFDCFQHLSPEEHCLRNGDGIAATPVVTQVTIHSTKPVPVHTEHLLSTFRASTAGGTQIRTKVFHVDNSPSPKQAQDHGTLDTNALNAQPSQNSVWHKVTPRKSHSVADLRKVFERGSGAKIPQRSSVSLPNTPRRQLPRRVGTKTKVFENSGDPCRRRGTEPDSKLGEAVKPETLVTPAQHPRIWSRLPVRQRRNTPTVRQAEGRALRESLVDELAQTIHHRARPFKLTNIVHQAPVNMTDSRLDSPRPLLSTRTLPMKAYTVRPASSSGLPKPSPCRRAKQNTDPLPEGRNHSTEARKARTGPSETQRLQHRSTQKESAPSLPPAPLRTSHTRAFLDGPADTASEGPQSQTFGARDSPVRDGIHIFEQLVRSAGSWEANRRNATSSGDSLNRRHGRRSSWGLKLSSHTLRSVSLNVRRKLSAGKGQSETSNGGPKSSIPIFKRHTLPYFGTTSPSELLVAEARQEPSFSLRATLRKISKSHHSPDTASPAAARLGPRATPSIELLNKTSKIAPRPFPSIRTFSRQLLKPTWLTLHTDNENDDNSLLRSHATANSTPQNPHTENNTPPKRLPRHKSSLGDALGGSWGKTAATTLLSEAPAVACDIASHTARSGFHAHTHSSRDGGGQSWGRRAATRGGLVSAIGVGNSGRVESKAAGMVVGGARDKVASGGVVGKSESGKRLEPTPPAPGTCRE